MRHLKNLYREHSRLVDVMFTRSGGLTKSEMHRLNLIREKLDDAEMLRMRPDFERMRAQAAANHAMAKGIWAMVSLAYPDLAKELGHVE